jgi:hypothetical protein
VINKTSIKKLNKYQNNIYSQYGEDGIINYITSKIKINKSSLEVGAGDGIKFSNTRRLLELKYKCIYIESDNFKFKLLKKNLNKEKKARLLNLKVSFKGKNSLDNIFKLHKISPIIGILSIDIDSYDYYILKYLKYVKPQLIIIEYNNSLPNDIEYHDSQSQLFLRHNLKSLEVLAKKKGYVLIASTVTNAFLLKKNLFNKKYLSILPAEVAFDYEGQRANNTYPKYIIKSQMITIYPILSYAKNNFTTQIIWLIILMKNFLNKFIYNDRTPFIRPNLDNIKKIKKAKFYY